MIDDLQPTRGVPDALSEDLQHAAETPEEGHAGRVLRIHRDWLNGGFEQTFHNLEEIEEPVDRFVQAYSEIGLVTIAALVAEAAAAWATKQLSDDDWEQLDGQYERLIYASADETADAIEGRVVEYILQHRSAFSNAIARASS